MSLGLWIFVFWCLSVLGAYFLGAALVERRQEKVTAELAKAWPIGCQVSHVLETKFGIVVGHRGDRVVVDTGWSDEWETHPCALRLSRDGAELSRLWASQ